MEYVREVSKKPITLEPKNTLYDARNAMLRYNISRIVIAIENRPLGIITEKDIARLIVADPTKRLDEIYLEEAMKRDLITIGEGATIKKAAELMLEKGISSILVTEGEELKGIVTKSDLVQFYSAYYAKRYKVKDYMNKPVHIVRPDDNIHKILILMNTYKISRVIVARDKKVIGIVTTRDLLPMSSLLGSDAYNAMREVFRDQAIVPSGISSVMLARDLMKYDPMTIEEEADLAEAAHIMVRNRISGLPVINTGQELRGIVTKTDIIKAL